VPFPCATVFNLAAMDSITLNGKPYGLPKPAFNLRDLIVALSLEGKRVAIERNGEIVPKSQHPLTTLSPGDKIEIVAAVGGG
jgi:sulfur carrier protein